MLIDSGIDDARVSCTKYSVGDGVNVEVCDRTIVGSCIDDLMVCVETDGVGSTAIVHFFVRSVSKVLKKEIKTSRINFQTIIIYIDILKILINNSWRKDKKWQLNLQL